MKIIPSAALSFQVVSLKSGIYCIKNVHCASFFSTGCIILATFCKPEFVTTPPRRRLTRGRSQSPGQSPGQRWLKLALRRTAATLRDPHPRLATGLIKADPVWRRRRVGSKLLREKVTQRRALPPLLQNTKRRSAKPPTTNPEERAVEVSEGSGWVIFMRVFITALKCVFPRCS